MAYWSLARCGINWFSMSSPNFEDKYFERYRTFLKEAGRRKEKLPQRERMYIEAWEQAVASPEKEHVKTITRKLQEIVIKFPDDLEAKATLALFNIGEGSAYANELLIQQVLAKNPMHPGAHHASIHNWDGVSPEQTIRSCELYGESAPNVGHALHMPGHIYSKIGMWHEAAIAMDSATRTELGYMNDRLALPFETWNYPHNRNYLCYIQEQLGMEQASIQGAKDLLSAPRDPERNPEMGGGLASEGRAALTRALLKFERWEELLKPGAVPWDASNDFGKFEHAFCETLALTGLNRLVEARERLADLKSANAKVAELMKANPLPGPSPFDMSVELASGVLAMAEGNLLEGQRDLLTAAEKEQKLRQTGFFLNDPPSMPWPITRLLGDRYREQGHHALAIECYERALKDEPNDGFALSGLAQSHFAAGRKDRAAYYAGRLSYVWSKADPNLKWMEAVRKLNLQTKPVAETPRKERQYEPKSLDKLGPMNWQPFNAPKLQVLNVDGHPVDLKNYEGKNVVLVFFLGEACVHCVGQLKALNDRAADFQGQNTVVLGVCSASPDKLKASATLGDIGVTFLSDKDHGNARRFASYDDFEEMELHSTILIDKKGRVRWKRTGGAPFMDVDFLLNELKRMNGAG